MQAILIQEPGGPEVLTLTEVPDPEPGPGEVLLRVTASAVNRADLLQRQGNYPVPPGASEIPGLECAGTIVALGPDVAEWRVGDEVCALLAGGGYAELVAVPAEQLLPVPSEVEPMIAAALPEVACTVWSMVIMTAGLRAGETLLVHGGSGGIGTHAIQVGAALGATVLATAGSDARADRCRQLGATEVVNYHDGDFVAMAKKYGGADVILDNMGASYLDRNVKALGFDGRLAVIGMQGGVKGELNLGALLGKRGQVFAAGLRGRPVKQKAAIVAQVRDRLWPLVENSSVQPIVDQVLPMSEVAEAHRALETGGIFGKILLAAKS